MDISPSWPEELARRMAAPQRHRLLQGYPMVPLMRAAAMDPSCRRCLDGRVVDHRDREVEPSRLTLDSSRPLIIGVIPHTQCKPRIRGCGFCTFGQDPYYKRTLVESVREARAEIEELARRWPQVAGRRVDAVYVGGGTANLTPAGELRGLGATLAWCFDLQHAEVTLEGVPALFQSIRSGPLGALLDTPARHRRISMGVQTFDRAQIQRMGRERFGDRKTVGRVVEKAHRHGLTASGDFLFNLPHQSRAAMLEDIRAAVALGLDQICVYHLVLHPQQRTPWARDEALIAALPGPAEAVDNWLAVRDLLLSQGFVQTTLTNFERADAHGSARRFVYEECSFTPETYDALGFGPLAITTVTSLAERRGLKFFRTRQREPGPEGGTFRAADLYFPYDEDEDRKLLFITRSLPRLRIDREVYRAVFGADLHEDFAGQMNAVMEQGLATLDEDAAALSPRGMFFADAVAGLFASRRAEKIRGMARGVHTADVLHETVDYAMG